MHESHHNEAPRESAEKFTLMETNSIQAELMSEFGDELGWVNQYSAKFREIIDHDPTLHDLYTTDHHAFIEEMKMRLHMPSDTLH